MNTMVMTKAQCCAAATARVSERRTSWQLPMSMRLLARRAGIAVSVAVALGLLVALIAVTPTAVEAIATPPVLRTVELPRVVILGTRFTPGACPLPTDSSSSASAAACPVPVTASR